MNERRRNPLHILSYAVVGFLLAGLLVSVAVMVAAEERPSTFSPWVVGFGGTLAFVVFAGHTVLATWTLCQSWLLRLFGEDTWAVLTAKDSRWDSDSTRFWTAYVAGDGFCHTIDTATADPGTVGGWLRVRRHAASGQVELVKTYGRGAALIRDIVIPLGLAVSAGITVAIGYGLYRWALGLLQ